MIGIIQSNLSPAATTQRVAQMVKRICEQVEIAVVRARAAASIRLTQCPDLQTYGVAPAVTVRGHVDATFPYIPVHLEYILMEARASRGGQLCASRLRPPARDARTDCRPCRC